MKTIGYIRVSLEKQVDQGSSLAAQRAKLDAYAVLFELDLVEIIVDKGESAKSLDRPGLRRALKMLEDGQADALLVPKLDRLTRSIKDLCALVERFERNDIALLSVAENLDTTSAVGRLVMNMLVSVAQWERETIGERTSAVLVNMRERGLYTGGHVRYGYRVGECNQLEPDPDEQQVIDIVRAFRSSGTGLRETARKVNELGLRTRNGTEFYPAQIKNICGGTDETTTTV